VFSRCHSIGLIAPYTTAREPKRKEAENVGFFKM
jgi:hypothetical protein